MSAGPTRPAVGAGSMVTTTPSPTSSRREAGGGRDPDRPQSTSPLHVRRDRVRGLRRRHDRLGAAGERRRRRGARHVHRPAAGHLHGRTGGAERARPGRLAERCVEPMLRAAVEIVDGLVAIHWRVAGGWWRTDNGRFDGRYRHVEVLVVGGREAGRRAATEAAAVGSGDRVAWSTRPGRGPNRRRRGDDPIDCRRHLPDHGYDVIADRRPGQQTEGASTARAGRIVLATGAVGRPLVFRDNDRPGIMLAGSAAAYVQALTSFRVGGSSSSPPTPGAVGGPRPRGGRGGDRRARGSTDQRPGDRQGTAAPAACAVLLDGRRVEADLLLVSGGWNPNVALPTGAGARSGTTKTPPRLAPGPRTQRRRDRPRRRRRRRPA